MSGVREGMRKELMKQSETGEVSVAPRFYSVAQVAKMLGTSPMTLYRAIAEGEFPAVRIRGRLIIPAKALDALVEAAVGTATPRASEGA
jgi:excisionase family DNA binding protein